MPKRISKNQLALIRERYHGAYIGRAFTILALNLQILRNKKKLTALEASEKSGVSLRVIDALESARPVNINPIHIDDLIALVVFYDAGLVERFVSLLSGTCKEETVIRELVDSISGIIQDNETISKVEHYKILAEKDLQIHQLEQRLKGANNMTKSYMGEFEKRGLVYIP
jgi:hypothetical protein